jgi:ribosome biogenesis protein MAK21
MAESSQFTRQDEFMLHKEAETLLTKDNYAYQAKCESQERNQDMDYRWIRTVLSKGTLADKIAANTILIQDSPKNNLSCLEHLSEMINPKSKREALMAMDALKELFVSDLLMEHKLRPFGELIAGVDSKEFHARKTQLTDAYYEDQLRQIYRRFVESVEQFTHDPDSQTKCRAIKVLFELLAHNSEQEQFLLEKLVNKLGDPEARSSSLVVQLLSKLTNDHHPAMKEIVLKEVERVLYRTNIAEKAQYCALCFLSSIKYVRGEYEVANRVVKVFLSFFKASIKKKSVNGRSMAIILSGLTRAHPFSNLESNFMQEQLDTVYKVAHMVSFNVAIQAYSVIFAVITKDQSGYLGDRYSSALYRSLLEPNLDQCSRKAVYLNLLYKSLKTDSVGKRVTAFVRRLLQVCMNQPSNIAAAYIMLISSAFKDKPEVRKEFVVNFNKLSIENPLLQDDDEDEEEHYIDHDEDENDEGDNAQSDSDEDDEKPIKSTKSKKNEFKAAPVEAKKSASSWVHSRNTTKEKVKLNYDALHRNPLYANADIAKPFELCTLRNHFHPTVVHFTEQVLEGQRVQYDGDALYDFNVKSFLDKFVYKNPKKISKAEKNASREQSVFERNLRHKAQRIQINRPGYVSQLEQQVPVEERFIYTFLKNKSKFDLDDRASISSDDFNDFVLTRFEKSFDAELTADIMADKKKKKRNDDDDDDFEEDDDLGVDFEMDDDYKDAIKDCVDDLGLNELNANGVDLDEEGEGLVIDDEVSEDDEEEEDDEDEDGESRPKNRKRDKNLMDLFASADEFAHLLEENEDAEGDNGMEDFGKDGGDDEDEDEDALDFDDDEETLNKRRNRSQNRKEKTEKDARIQQYKSDKKEKEVNQLAKEKRQSSKKFDPKGKFKKPNNNAKFAGKGNFKGPKRFNKSASKSAPNHKKQRTH